MNKLLAALSGLVLSVSLAQAAEFSSLEERMSRTDFQAAGLDKLSPDELKTLNDWLSRHGFVEGDPVATRPGAKPEFYPDQLAREAVESRIQGEFNGWRGKTRFTLENGQIWEQAESGMKGDVHLDNPAVKVKPMLFGSWLMAVDGCGCSVRVRRVK